MGNPKRTDPAGQIADTLTFFPGHLLCTSCLLRRDAVLDPWRKRLFSAWSSGGGPGRFLGAFWGFCSEEPLSLSKRVVRSRSSGYSIINGASTSRELVAHQASVAEKRGGNRRGPATSRSSTLLRSSVPTAFASRTATVAELHGDQKSGPSVEGGVDEGGWGGLDALEDGFGRDSRLKRRSKWDGSPSGEDADGHRPLNHPNTPLATGQSEDSRTPLGGFWCEQEPNYLGAKGIATRTLRGGSWPYS